MSLEPSPRRRLPGAGNPPRPSDGMHTAAVIFWGGGCFSRGGFNPKRISLRSLLLN